LADVAFGLESIGSRDFLPLLGINEEALIGASNTISLIEGRVVRIDDLRIDSSLFVAADVARIHQI
jgi:hypothetical protein